MRYATLERWSRQDSWLHRRDPRAKLGAALVFLVAVSTAPYPKPALAAAWLACLGGAALWARLPLGALLARAALVLPFSLAFAALSALGGDPARGVALLLKSYLSATAVLVLVATTPIPRLLRGLEMSGVPRFLLLVVQFLYRYLFVIAEEADAMRTAALARAARRNWLFAGTGVFRAGAGALAVLFARSYGRAAAIHHAMLARGFDGHFRPLDNLSFRMGDGAFLLIAASLPVALRAGLEGWLR